MFVFPMLTLELYTPNDDDRPVYVTGTFNSWKTRDPRYCMTRVRAGHYHFTFENGLPTGEPLEYKYVKGGWEAEELDGEGHPPVNRRMETPRGKVIDVVARWKAHGAGYNPDFYPDIRVVAKRFIIPQLNRRRRIAVLLPWNYESTTRRYPVLYLQDGQNLFEDGGPFGTWELDKRLAALAQRGLGDFIVVAIDHGGKDRIREYAPYDSPKWGEGLGQEYTRFLAETLKPYIDANFRTLSDRAHTGIGGSSMGGLISIYAGLMFPHIYSRFMIFSPSFWASPELFFEPMRFSQYPLTRIYLYGGEKEGSGMVTNMERFKETLDRQHIHPDCVQVKMEVDPQGRHHEARWGKEFPKAAKWLFFDRLAAWDDTIKG
jgi:predicted alpha/beta superfamily hydrolase